MNAGFQDLTIDQRIRLVEDLWDSIAADQGNLPLTDAQRAELDHWLAGFDKDRNMGKEATDVIERIRKSL